MVVTEASCWEWQVIHLMHTASPTLDKVCISPCPLTNSLRSYRIKTAARGPGQLFRITKPWSMHQDSVMIGAACECCPSPNPPMFHTLHPCSREVPTTSAK